MKSLYRHIRIHIIRLLAFILGKKIDVEGNNVLIVAPHPDDEVFGSAGLIQQLINQQKKVSVIILTRGENSLQKWDKDEITSAREEMAIQAASLLKHDLYWADMEDGNIRNSDTQKLFELIENINPDVIFVPHYLEGWSDHEATEKIVFNWTNGNKKKIKLYYYCVWFWFSMPYSKFNQVQWKKARTLSMNETDYQNKKRAINIYLEKKTSFGQPYSGVLPKEFLYANSWNKELFFEAK